MYISLSASQLPGKLQLSSSRQRGTESESLHSRTSKMGLPKPHPSSPDGKQAIWRGALYPLFLCLLLSVGWILAPKDVQVLIPKTFECGSFSGKRDFVYVVKLRVLRWGEYSGLSRWALCNHKGLIRGRWAIREDAVQLTLKRGQTHKQSLQCKWEETNSCQEEPALPDTLILAQWGPLWTCDLQNGKRKFVLL